MSRAKSTVLHCLHVRRALPLITVQLHPHLSLRHIMAQVYRRLNRYHTTDQRLRLFLPHTIIQSDLPRCLYRTMVQPHSLPTGTLDLGHTILLGTPPSLLSHGKTHTRIKANLAPTTYLRPHPLVLRNTKLRSNLNTKPKAYPINTTLTIPRHINMILGSRSHRPQRIHRNSTE